MGYIGSKPANKPITSADIEDSIIVAADLAANSVDSSELVDGSIDTSHLSADAVDGTKLADDAVNSEHYTDGSIDTAHIGASQVTDAKIDTMAATKLTGSIADARVPASAVTQHVTAFDDTDLRNDISALALHTAVADDKSAYNLPNSFIEQFQDDTGIQTETTGDRNSSEYWSSGTSVTGWHSSGTNSYVYYNSTNGTSGARYTADSGFVLTGNGCIEMWIYPTDEQTADRGGLFGTTDQDSWTADAYHFNYQSSALKFGINQDPSSQSFSTSSSLVGGWHHVALSRYGSSSNNVSVFLDGNRIGQFTDTATWGSSSMKYIIGSHEPNGSTGFRGYIDEFRLSDDKRYDGATYTVPTAPFSVDGATKVLIHFEDTGMTDSNNNVSLDTLLGTTARASMPASTVINATATLISNASVSSSAQTKVSGVALYKDNQGTATLGTDLKIYFSCNNGSNWTEAASYGTVSPVFSTGVKMIRLGETTCTSGTQILYKAVWANQSSGSKETQLHGIGMNY